MVAVQNIVVVGGGGAGAGVVRDLTAKVDATKYRVVLINPRPFFAFLIAGARMSMTAEGALEDQALIPFDPKLGGHGELVVGTVESIRRASGGQTGGDVVLTDGRTIPFAILVLAPGGAWTGPLVLPDSRPAVDAWLADWRTKVARAKSVAIVGGGAVGIELAGEIRHYHPTVRVTIVHKYEHLLNDAYPLWWRTRFENKLRARGVTLVLGTALDIPSELTQNKSLTTRDGTILDVDLVIPATGARPNTDFVRSLGDDVLASTGHIRVQPTLQVPGFPEVFAAGDAIAWREQKQLVKCYAHTSVVTANVLALTQGKTPATNYKGSTELIVVTFGPNGGSAYFDVLWGISLGDWLCSLLKSSSLMISSVRKTFRL